VPRFPAPVGPPVVNFPVRFVRSRAYARDVRARGTPRESPRRRLSTNIIRRIRRTSGVRPWNNRSSFSPCTVAEVSRRSADRGNERESETERKKEGRTKQEERKEREAGSVRKRAKRSSTSDFLPVGQRRDEEPCVAKECVAPAADRGGQLGDSIRGESLENIYPSIGHSGPPTVEITGGLA